MLFFNKKEEVIDIQLTQYGKHLLARGRFKPEYYCFFDDDILYDSTKAGFSEHQNESQARILENTPKLKTQYLTYGVENFNILKENPRSGPDSYLNEVEGDYFDFNLQNTNLLYAMGSKEAYSAPAPCFDVVNLDSHFKQSISYQHFTSSGIIKNVPQINTTINYTMTKGKIDADEQPYVTSESNFDFSSDEIIFTDNTFLKIDKESLCLDIEEISTFNSKENFYLEIYEIEKINSKPDKLYKICTPEKIRKLFHIRTDESIELPAARARLENKNHQRRRE